jgi:thiol-disulfide isomerase/thioredoxin
MTLLPGFAVLRRLLLPAALLLGLSVPARALEMLPYDAAQFAKARAAGKVSAVQFHSGWCPLCVMQERGLVSLQEDKSLDQVLVFRADFNKEDELRKRLGVHSFSTLVIFKGEVERARTTGDFRPDQLKRLFDLALQ